MDAVFGRHNRSHYKEGVAIPVEKFILHENFTSLPDHDIYDVALLKLSRPIDTNKYRPICLPNPGKYLSRL